MNLAHFYYVHCVPPSIGQFNQCRPKQELLCFRARDKTAKTSYVQPGAVSLAVNESKLVIQTKLKFKNVEARY